VRNALRAGYRLIDTAAAYGNERQVGEAVHSSDIDRSEIFLETKIWIGDYGYNKTLRGFEKSARKLGVDQIDLLILHHALPSAFDRTLEAYRALETLLADGKVRAIGVSNFIVEHLTTLLEHATVVPAVNQIELHPYFQQPAVQALNAGHDILTQAWSPIGGITFYRDGGHGSTLDDRVVADIARSHGKTPAQVMLRWGLQHGRSVIPKSTKPSRITENIDVFDFELSANEMAAIVYAPYRSGEMHWFCKPHPSRRTHHLHLVPVDSARFGAELAFRDYLRAHRDVAEEYGALKRELANEFRNDREAYTGAKTDFIHATLERALDEHERA
jgi:diketogulonate reductase-like aldo/keto reductase